MSKLKSISEDFKQALNRLDEVLKKEKDEFMRDSAIKRFELVFDLSWKAAKSFLEENHGVICKSPKACFREAYKQGIIEYDDFWIGLTDMRNKTTHAYDEILADDIYAKLPNALKHFKNLFKKIK